VDIYIDPIRKAEGKVFTVYVDGGSAIINFIRSSSLFGVMGRKEALQHSYRIRDAFDKAMGRPPEYRYYNLRYYVHVPFI